MKAELVKIEPEGLEVANSYLQTLSMQETARQLCISLDEVSAYLENKTIKKYIDNVFMQQGYMNKYSLQSIMDTMIANKLLECEESEVYTNKDLADLLVIQHKMRMDEMNLQVKLNADPAIGKQVNIQNNNYSQLLEKIISPD